jgi:hypothetical protein
VWVSAGLVYAANCVVALRMSIACRRRWRLRLSQWDAGDASAHAQRPAPSAAMARAAHARSETNHSAVTHDRDDPGGTARTPDDCGSTTIPPPGKIVGPGGQTLACPDSSCTSTTGGTNPRPTDYETVGPAL